MPTRQSHFKKLHADPSPLHISLPCNLRNRKSLPNSPNETCELLPREILIMASDHLPTTTITAISMIIVALTLSTAANSAPNDLVTSQASSFYEVLKSHALPIGLFPDSISQYSIDPNSGRFELHLQSPSPCQAKFETHFKYEWNITGSLSYGKIANLSGVAAQELFLWLPVKEIQVDVPSSGLIYFDVGVVSKQFSLSFFETPKDCNAVKGDGERDDMVMNHGDRVGAVEDLEKHSEMSVIEQPKEEEGRAVS